MVIISTDGIYLNNQVIADYFDVKEQEGWMIESLKKEVIQAIELGKIEKKNLASQIREASPQSVVEEDEIDAFRKMTIQADKSIDFLTVKKVMYTVTESGVFEINFAVLENKDET